MGDMKDDPYDSLLEYINYSNNPNIGKEARINNFHQFKYGIDTFRRLNNINFQISSLLDENTRVNKRLERLENENITKESIEKLVIRYCVVFLTIVSILVGIVVGVIKLSMK